LSSQQRKSLVTNTLFKIVVKFRIKPSLPSTATQEQNNPNLGEEGMLEDLKAGGRISDQTRNWPWRPKLL
jgi:hypothetical protein